MKSVLISIKPKWCELIANGKKSVEIRKTRPKLCTPFKCYIYCTLNGTSKIPLEKYFNGKWHKKKGKVIGEFICDRIQNYECEFTDDICYEEIASIAVDEDGDITGFIEWSNDGDLSYENTDLYRESCVQYNELKKYMGMGFGNFYGWHISKLKIYGKPKELSEFRKYISFFDGESLAELEEEGISNIRIKKAPQSWCYVEEVKS